MTEQERDATCRIPACTDREEEAPFWYGHDTTDYEDEFTPVRVRFAQNLSEGIPIRLDRETLDRLREQAKAV